MGKIFRYGIIGVATTLINIAVDFLLRTLGVHYSIAIIIAWLASVTFAFWGNKNIVFKNNASNKIRLYIEFMSSRILTLLIEIGFSALCIDVFNMSQVVVKILVQIVIIVLNYILGVLIFDKKKKK